MPIDSIVYRQFSEISPVADAFDNIKTIIVIIRLALLSN